MAETIQDRLSLGEFEIAAEDLRSALAPLAFDDAVQDSFGDAAIVQPSGVVAMSLLPRLAHGPIVTTNFDRVLERVFEQGGQPFDRVVWGAKEDSVVQALQLDRRFLLKVHGDVEDSASRVLTRAEYDAQYGELVRGEDASRPLGRLLQRVLESRAVLFLGCSLQNDRIVTILRNAAQREGAFTHYAILQEPGTTAEKRDRLRLLSEARIRPIWFPPGRHDLIVPFLEVLLSETAASDAAPLPALVSADEFFSPLLRSESGRLFHHSWDLVGRAEHVQKVNAWISSEAVPVAVLTGSGGIGKSKLLHGVSLQFPELHSDKLLRFAVPHIPFSNDNLVLSAGTNVIVVDDAHRRDDLGVLLGFVRRNSSRVKLLLVSRPHRADSLRLKLSEARFDVREVEDLGQLTQLTRAEIRQLASQALGASFEQYADRLTRVTRDSPLVTVLGGQLLAERSVSPELLERDEEFRRTLLDRFQAELTGQLSELFDPRLLRKVLQLVSATAPVRPEDDRFLALASDHVGLTSGEVLEAIDALEAAGLLLRRGRRIRITPDVLADHILHDACVRQNGMPTGYAEQIFFTFRSVLPSQILENLAELDWRIRSTGPDDSILLNAIWDSLESELREGTRRERHDLLSLLVEVAYHQPERTLRIVELAMNNPAPSSLELARQLPWELDMSELEVVPRILRRIAYNIDYLPHCCELLWKLGRDDNRSLNTRPDHAIRVLTDIAKYDLGKPLRFNSTVLDAVERWLADDSAHKHRHSLLDILDPILAKVESSDYADGLRVVIRSFSIDSVSTKPIRQRALSLMKKCLATGDLMLTLRAIDSLVAVLQEPMPLHNMIITPGDVEQWLPERRQALKFIEDTVRSSSDSLVHLHVAKKLAWYTDFKRHKEFSTHVRAVMDAIPKALELCLLAALAGEYSVLPTPDGSYSFSKFAEQQKRDDEAIREFVGSFIAAYPEANSAALALDGGLKRLVDIGTNPLPWRLWGELSMQCWELLDGIAAFVISNPESVLANYLGVFLAHISDVNHERASDLATLALDREHLSLSLAVSNWGRNCAKDPHEKDVAIIERLIGHHERAVVASAVQSLELLARHHPALAADFALRVNICKDEILAEWICCILKAAHEADPSVLELSDISAVLIELREIPSIGGYHTREFLRIAIDQLPRLVVALLLGRISDDASRPIGEFEALPFHGLEEIFSDVSNHSEYVAVLQDIRDQALGNGWQMKHWLPKLFAAASSGFSSPALVVLQEWATSGDREKVQAAARLIRDAPPAFVFNARNFVVDLLNHAHDLNSDTYHEVSFHLGSSVHNGGRQRTLGVDDVYPEDVAQAHGAANALSELLPGSPAYRFYADLKQAAEDSMRHERLLDEEEFD